MSGLQGVHCQSALSNLGDFATDRWVSILFNVFNTCTKCFFALGIVTFTLYPYGNARQSILPNGMWDFKCQHGPTECHLNLVEACILQSVDFDESIYLPAINCIEKSTDPVSSAKDCVQNFLPNVPWEEITKCVEVSKFIIMDTQYPDHVKVLISSDSRGLRVTPGCTSLETSLTISTLLTISSRGLSSMESTTTRSR